MVPAKLQVQLKELLDYFQKSDYQSVIAHSQKIQKKCAKFHAFWGLLGTSYLEIKEFGKAEKCLKKAAELQPQDHQHHLKLGICYIEQNKPSKAIPILEKAITLDNKNEKAYNSLGFALILAERFKEAKIKIETALQLNPKLADAHNCMGICHDKLGQFLEAKECFEKAIALDQNFILAKINLAKVYLNLNDIEASKTIFTQALAIDSANLSALIGLGVIHEKKADFSASLSLYQKALKNYPDKLELNGRIANTLVKSNRIIDAIFYYQKELKLNPQNSIMHHDLGSAYQALNDYKSACLHFKKALMLDPSLFSALANLFFMQSKHNDWASLPDTIGMIKQIELNQQMASPFTMLSYEDNPENQLSRAKLFAETQYELQQTDKMQALPHHTSKINIAYVSSDFQDHAVTHLMAGFLERHDKTKFNVTGISIGPVKEDKYRERVKAAFDQFYDTQEMTDGDIVNIIKSNKIDILINCNGYTENSRNTLFAQKSAPIQVNYLGYPGTMGAHFMDYIVGDPVIIPSGAEKYYSEKIIRLPHCYQPNDDKRAIPNKSTSRTEYGLPSEAFIFCCFNNSYKITRQEFEIWMRLLSRVPNSVLWLLKPSDLSIQNIHDEAKTRGIDNERIIFAEKVTPEEHLNRHKLADLFLDCFIYNAHTTASDALWGGLPVLTKTGEQFSARVATSILKAAKLEELIVTTEKDYEELAYKLATDRPRLEEIKNKLLKSRLHCPLFNTDLYCKHLEQGYQKAYLLFKKGKEPQDITINALQD